MQCRLIIQPMTTNSCNERFTSHLQNVCDAGKRQLTKEDLVEKAREVCAGISHHDANKLECYYSNALWTYSATCCGALVGEVQLCGEIPECVYRPTALAWILVMAILIVLTCGIYYLVKCCCRGGVARGINSRTQPLTQGEMEMGISDHIQSLDTLSAAKRACMVTVGHLSNDGAPPNWGQLHVCSVRSDSSEEVSEQRSSVSTVPSLKHFTPHTQENYPIRSSLAARRSGGEARVVKRVSFDIDGESGEPTTSVQDERHSCASQASCSSDGSSSRWSSSDGSFLDMVECGTLASSRKPTDTREHVSPVPRLNLTTSGSESSCAASGKDIDEGKQSAGSLYKLASAVLKMQKPETARESEPYRPEKPAEEWKQGETITGKSVEEEVCLWIEVLSQERRQEVSFSDWLRDGQVLCKAANAIQPGIVKNINLSKMPFKQMENITNFIKACRQLGVLEKDLFSTVDLYESKNLKAVVRCIHNLGNAVRGSKPDFPGPHLGIAQAGRVEDARRSSMKVNWCAGLRSDVARELQGAQNLRIAGAVATPRPGTSVTTPRPGSSVTTPRPGSSVATSRPGSSKTSTSCLTEEETSPAS